MVNHGPALVSLVSRGPVALTLVPHRPVALILNDLDIWTTRHLRLKREFQLPVRHDHTP